MKNLNIVTLQITEQGLKRFLKTPTYSNLLYKSQIESLRVGENKLTINNTVKGKLERLSDEHIRIV